VSGDLKRGMAKRSKANKAKRPCLDFSALQLPQSVIPSYKAVDVLVKQWIFVAPDQRSASTPDVSKSSF